MAAKIDSVGAGTNPLSYMCYADTDSDMQALDTTDMTWGSSFCLVLADSSVWALNSNKEWVEI